ncbi:MAG: nitroreductase family protein [Dysgonamonadaceae bacterium]|jgi:nitroreductase|nr:nitroreductase family protein [Dysgonamonadaceae bacterium]
MKSLKNRRTIRKYSDKPVSDKLLNELLEIAARTSTTGNMQLYSVIVTRDESMKATLAPAHFNQPMATQAPVVLTICADFNRFNKWCILRNAVPGYDNFVSFFNAAMDALFFAQTFCVAAEEKGLGICYLGTTTYNPDKIIDILALPKFVIPVTTITLGYPEVIPPQPDRLPIESFVHHETYNDYKPQDIDSYYSNKESLPENHQFIKENHKETLAQVFTDVRYKKADNEHFSKVLLETLKRQGFHKG